MAYKLGLSSAYTYLIAKNNQHSRVFLFSHGSFTALFDIGHDDNDSRGYLGRTSLRLILQADKERRSETYHEGECIFDGDLRGLIGVVRWHPADEAPKAENHKDYPDSNLLRVGGRAHEQSS